MQPTRGVLGFPLQYTPGVSIVTAMPARRLLPLLLVSGSLFAQAPTLDPRGPIDAAGYGATVAPGSIAAVFGTFGVAQTEKASSLPLPDSLEQFSLEFIESKRAAPLFFVSGAQANIQIPWELSGQSNVTATLGFQDSSPRIVNLAPFAPGIFAANQQGTGQGSITDSSFRMVDQSNPAKAGSTVIVIFCTGLGAVTNPPPDGQPAPTNVHVPTTTQPTVIIGGVPALVQFSGLAPGWVGEYQVNALVPLAAPAGNDVPVTIYIGGAISNTVTIAVQRPDSDARADTLLRQMTQDEKLQLVHGAGGPVGQSIPGARGAAGYVPGIPHLGIPDLYLADGSVGLGNGVGPATALPSSIASAATWNLGLAYQYGKVIGSEMRAYGVNVNLGGNINLIGREPRDGRTFETKGEDPVLAGRITAAHIRGLQDQHVVGGIKHYALNDQETDRFTANVQIDERAARESDLLAFEIGIADSDVQSVMCSYNLVNGIYACENPHLLNDVLKGDWAFPGFVMSDWGATHSTAAAANAGLDQEQPNSDFFGGLGHTVQSGQVQQARLDNMVHRILRGMYEVGLFDFPESLGPINTAADETVATQVEEQGAVLLRNAGGQLPLSAAKLHSIAVIGSHADVAVLSGGGSAQVSPTGGPALTEGYPAQPGWAQVVWDPSSPLQAIQAAAPGAAVQFDPGTHPKSAATAAASADVAIVFVSQWESEGMDLPSLNFTDVIHANPIDQDALVEAVSAANPHTVVVLENGGAQVIPWLNNVAAVLEAWYPGQRGGEAIANLLFGAVNPSGKLPITFPASVSQLPHPAIASGSSPFPVNYTEGFNVGYKYFDANNLTPLFPFGFGLSYTTFSFANAAIVNQLSSAYPRVLVTVDITNTGSVAGAEVAQAYVGLPASTGEPPHRLAGWDKVYLQPGETRHVTIPIYPNNASKPLSYWDAGSNAWKIAPGAYTVYVGDSSAAAALSVAGTFQQ